MIPSTFDYAAPRALEDVLFLLKSGGANAKLLSGGQSLIPVLKLRLSSPERLIDLGRIPGLRRINVETDPISIGAMATHASIEDSEALRAVCPLLPQVAGCIGDRQVRNRGTIGGSLANADPAADWSAAVLALDAELLAAGPGDAVQSIPARKFFQGMMKTALAPGSVLVEVRVRRPAPGGAAYQKVRQSASGFAIAGVAAVVEYGPDRVCKQVRIGITGVAQYPFPATAVEKALVGKRLDEKTIAAASQLVGENVDDPISDIHASGNYRLHLAKVHCARALRRAAGLNPSP